MRNIFKLFLFAMITFIALPIHAYDFEVDGIYYNINATDRTATVTYGDYMYEGDIIIPSSVTYANHELPVATIGFKAFYKCTSLNSIEIPNSVTIIDAYAFTECSSIVSMEIPNSVTEIGKGAFSMCHNLVSINIPNSVIKIGDEAFYSCIRLLSVKISNSVTEIGNEAFYRCYDLASINIPNSVTSIGFSSFYSCQDLNYVMFMDGETDLNLGYDYNNGLPLIVSFSSSPIEELYLGRNLIFSYESPFYKNTGFKTISLGKYVTNARSIYPEKSEELKIINCYNSVPPMIQEFSNLQYANIIVNIPVGSLSAYQGNEVWGKFWNLQETLPNPDILTEQIVLNIDAVELNIGEILKLEATVLPEDASDKTIIWTTSNENIASVSEEGLVTAISVGKAEITATCGDVSAECQITVLDDAGVESLLVNPENEITIYSTDGILIKKDCKVEDLKTLNKGIYIIVSGKDRYKISI